MEKENHKYIWDDLYEEMVNVAEDNYDPDTDATYYFAEYDATGLGGSYIEIYTDSNSPVRNADIMLEASGDFSLIAFVASKLDECKFSDILSIARKRWKDTQERIELYRDEELYIS